jgi:hypothetical protein
MALPRANTIMGFGKEVTQMSTHAIERGGSAHAHLSATAREHLAWLIGGLVLAFLVPFVFADTLDLPRDLFYGVYVVSVAAFFLLWAKTTGQPIGPMIRRRWRLAVALGLLAAAILAVIVLQKDSTARAEGVDFVGALLWRGVVYGAADGLLLSVFPILAVFAIFDGTKARKRVVGKIAIGSAALVASMVMTATYHLGYSDFRSEKLRQPVAGSVVWSAPTLLTLNPIGAPIAHAGLHVSAVFHSYETDLFLPPHEWKEVHDA